MWRTTMHRGEHTPPAALTSLGVISDIKTVCFFVRYMEELLRLRAAAREQGCDYLTWNDIQACIDQVNMTVQEEHERKTHSHPHT